MFALSLPPPPTPRWIAARRRLLLLAASSRCLTHFTHPLPTLQLLKMETFFIDAMSKTLKSLAKDCGDAMKLPLEDIPTEDDIGVFDDTQHLGDESKLQINIPKQSQGVAMAAAATIAGSKSPRSPVNRSPRSLSSHSPRPGTPNSGKLSTIHNGICCCWSFTLQSFLSFPSPLLLHSYSYSLTPIHTLTHRTISPPLQETNPLPLRSQICR